MYEKYCYHVTDIYKKVAGQDEVVKIDVKPLYSNIMLKQCDEEMKSYIHNNAVCRRKLLPSNFDHDLFGLDDYKLPHKCCDMCQKRCKCEVGMCMFKDHLNHQKDISQRNKQKD